MTDFFVNEVGITTVRDTRAERLLEGSGLSRLQTRATHVEPWAALPRFLFHLCRSLGDDGWLATWTRRWPCRWRVNYRPLGLGIDHGPDGLGFRRRGDAIATEVARLQILLKEGVRPVCWFSHGR